MPWLHANTTGTIGFVYETLFLYNPLTNEFIPWLAESGKWLDAEIYEATLRKGIKWTDGNPMTSVDVVFTFELGKRYPALWFSTVWNYLTSATALDEYRIEFKFSNPLYQDWDNLLYNLPVVPKHIWEGKTEEEITTGANPNPVGSGPYLYESHSEDRNVWIQNDNWWGKEILGLSFAPKRIVDIRVASNNIALGMVIKGELDLSNNFLPGVGELVKRGYIKTYLADEPYMLSVNTAVLVLNDPEVARKILADAGYRDVDGDGFVEAPDGSKIELKVTCPFGWTDWMEAIKIIAKSTQGAGINLKDETPDYGAWNTALVSGTFDTL